jgi:hypothetical protein
MSAREVVLLVLIVGAIALTLQFQNVIPERHHIGDTSTESPTTLPHTGSGG